MAHYHRYVENPLGDKHFLICLYRKHACDEPYVRDVSFNCGECSWCRAHPQTAKPDATRP